MKSLVIRRNGKEIPLIFIADWDFASSSSLQQIAESKTSCGANGSKAHTPQNTAGFCAWPTLTTLQTHVNWATVRQEQNEFEETLSLSRVEYKQAHPKVIDDPKIEQEVAFQTFCTQYKHEVKEQYLLKEIAKVLQKIDGNSNLYKHLLKQIDACNWAKNDTDLDDEIIKEFDNHIKDLTIKCNNHLMYTTEDWETFKLCLRHLSQNDIASVRDMLLLKL